MFHNNIVLFKILSIPRNAQNQVDILFAQISCQHLINIYQAIVKEDLSYELKSSI